MLCSHGIDRDQMADQGSGCAGGTAWPRWSFAWAQRTTKCKLEAPVNIGTARAYRARICLNIFTCLHLNLELFARSKKTPILCDLRLFYVMLLRETDR